MFLTSVFLSQSTPEGLEIFTISVPCLSVCSSINCHMVMNVMGWVNLVLAHKISFHDKEIVPQHAGITIWPALGALMLDP